MEKSQVFQPANPTRAGYKFAGWYFADSDGDVSFVAENVWNFTEGWVGIDMTLAAKWQKTTAMASKNTVSFNSNSGTSVKAVQVTTGSKINKPVNPTKKGYKFVGWYKNSKYTKAWNFTTDKVTASTVLYARWKK